MLPGKGDQRADFLFDLADLRRQLRRVVRLLGGVQIRQGVIQIPPHPEFDQFLVSHGGKKRQLLVIRLPRMEPLRRPCTADDSLGIDKIGVQRRGNHRNLLLGKQETVSHEFVLVDFPHGIADVPEAAPAVELPPCNGGVDKMPHVKPLRRPAARTHILRQNRRVCTLRLLITADADLQIKRRGGVQQSGKQLRMYPVVAVGENQPPAVAVGFHPINACVPGIGQAAVFLVDDMDAAVLPGVFVADFPAAVGTAVVHQNQLKILISLP